MRSLRFLVQRNIALFLNNKLNIILSFASIPVVVSLYVFFLRDFLTDMVGQSGVSPDYVQQLTDRLMFAGLLIVINTTTCFGIIQICVNDMGTGIRKDFLIAPVTPFLILSGYWLTSMLVSCVFTLLTALGGEIFFTYQYGSTLPLCRQLKVLMIILFSSWINSGILLCFAHKLKSTATFSTFANLYGTVIGFLAGAYLPYYFYPDWMKSMLLWFPPTQLTSIIRREYISVANIWVDTGNRTGFLDAVYQNFGVDLIHKNRILSVLQQWSILIFALAVILLYLWVCSYEKTVGKGNSVKKELS